MSNPRSRYSTHSRRIYVLLKNVDVVARARALARLGLPAERAAGDETLGDEMQAALVRASRALTRVRENPGASRHAEAQVPRLEPQVTVARANVAASSSSSVLEPLALGARDRVLK